MPIAGRFGRAGAQYRGIVVAEPFGASLPSRMPESTGQEYWIDSVNGSSGNSGTSVGSPKQTLAQVTALLGTTSSAHIYFRNNAEHDLGGSFHLFPNNKYGTDRNNPITLETWPADLSSAIGLPGTRGEARIVNGELRFQPGDLRRNDYNSGNGFNMRIRNLVFDEIPGATTAGGQGNAINGIRVDNAIGLEIIGCHINAPSFCGILVRGAGRLTTLNGGITNSQTSITVNSGADFLNATPFYVVLGGGDGVEIVRVTSMGGGTNWTVERGQLGTTAVAHSTGVDVEGYWQCSDVQIINCKIDEPSDGTDWAIVHSHGIYWASDNGINSNRGTCAILNCLFTRRNAARGGAYAINCYENGDDTIVSNCTVDGFRRGGVTISGEAVHATDDSVWVNNIITNTSTSSPGPGYAYDSYMTGDFGPGSGNSVRSSLWFTGLDYHRSDADANGITFGSIINDDPDYTDRTNGDYTLQGSSPAIGQGEKDFMLPFDIEGNERNDSNYALGAFVA